MKALKIRTTIRPVTEITVSMSDHDLIVSPIVMIKLLVSYSGKALLERGMRKSKGQAYDDYVARTSGFFPRPPRPARNHAS